VLAFLRAHVEPKEARLAGNSVHVDLGFLRAHMPDLASQLHYRIVDVTSVAELCARWFPSEYKRTPRKKARALPD
jgi:oligoribonuclease